jgi:hypothetical protein
MVEQVSGKVKFLTGGNGKAGVHNGPDSEARDPRKRPIW